MPTYYPASTYPFAIQVLSLFSALFFTVFKDRFIHIDIQIIANFGIQAVLLTIMPILANIGGSTGYWLMFIDLVVFGWFTGILAGAVYYENAKLPGKYIAIFMASQGISGISSNLIRFGTL